MSIIIYKYFLTNWEINLKIYGSAVIMSEFKLIFFSLVTLRALSIEWMEQKKEEQNNQNRGNLKAVCILTYHCKV